MSAATKAQAKDKLANFIIKIGYPDKWKDYSGLQVNDSLSLYENLQKMARWATDDEIAKHVNKKVDKTEWAFFDPTADDAANYGAIGGVIGHELVDGSGQEELRCTHEGARRLVLFLRGAAGREGQRQADLG